MTTNLRVLFLVGSLDPGGVELRALSLIEPLRARGIVLDVLCLSGRPGSLAPDFEARGSTVHRWASGLSDIRGLCRLFRSYDVIHSNVATASGYFLAIAAAARVPARLAHFRSTSDSSAPSRRRTMQRWVGRVLVWAFATDILGVSPGALDFARVPRAIARRRTVTVVPNGIDHRPVAAAPDIVAEKSPIVVNVGRPLSTKRRALAYDMCAPLGGTLVYVGADGEDLDHVRARCAASEEGLTVRFAGVRSDVREVLAAAACLVTPSTLEGLPGVVLEALSVGTPVVAADVPGAVWIAEHVAGVTIVPADAPLKQWQAAVARAVERSDSERDALLESFDASIFTLDGMVDRLSELYRRDRR